MLATRMWQFQSDCSPYIRIRARQLMVWIAFVSFPGALKRSQRSSDSGLEIGKQTRATNNFPLSRVLLLVFSISLQRAASFGCLHADDLLTAKLLAGDFDRHRQRQIACRGGSQARFRERVGPLTFAQLNRQ